MKPLCASILLLLAPYSTASQNRLPTQTSAVPDEASNTEQKSPYEGRKIRSLAFRGNQHFSSAVILEFMKVKVGDAYTQTGFEEDMDRLRVLLFGRWGYLKATVGEPQIEDSFNGLEVVVSIQEGVRYRLEGCNAFLSRQDHKDYWSKIR